MRQEPKLSLSEDDLVYACKVLDALSEAFDHVATQPQLAGQLAIELAQQHPEILDALLAITRSDCRPVLYDLYKSVMNAVRACLPKSKTKR